MARTSRIANRLPKFIAERQALAARSVTQALILGASEAAALTPIDTSVLINSQYRAVDKQGSKVVGRVGYTADYALAVHDPDNKQTFRRAGARKEFLKLGFERAEPNIRAIIKSGLKTR